MTTKRTSTRGSRGGRNSSQKGFVRGSVKRVKEFVSGSGNKKDKLRIMVIGGAEEVGRNCTLLEYNDDIIFIDMGLQFPEDDMPGIDYIIPNMEYVKDKKKNIRGVIITHGHLDHIGGIPHTQHELGDPPIYGLPLTCAIIKKRQENFGRKDINLKSVKLDDTLQLGAFKVEFFHVNHNIPDSMGIVVHTPVGTVIHTGDWKFDFQPVDKRPAELGRLAQLGNDGILAVMGDSTNAAHEGHQVSEHVIGKTLEDIFLKTKGRMQGI